MDIIDKIKLQYPLPIAKMYAAVNLETDPRLQTRKLIDLFEGVVRHLALIGLAAYTHHQLADENVEQLRPGLAKPSLGHWVRLLKALSSLVKPYNLDLLGNAADKKHTSDAIGKGTRAMAQSFGGSQRKRVMLPYFLEAAVEFRNKKFAHGNLISKPQARMVVKPIVPFLPQRLHFTPTGRRRAYSRLPPPSSISGKDTAKIQSRTPPILAHPLC